MRNTIYGSEKQISSEEKLVNSTKYKIARSQTEYFLENKMIGTGGRSCMNVDEMSAEFVVSGFFDKYDEWVSFAKFDCCNKVVECGLYAGEYEDKSLAGINSFGKPVHLLRMKDDVSQPNYERDTYTLESLHGENIADEGQEIELCDIPREHRTYRCLTCGTIYYSSEVRMVGAWHHNYEKYDTIERETPIEYGNPDCDPAIHEKGYVINEVNARDVDYETGEYLENEAYEPHTRLNPRTVGILRKFVFQARIGKGIEFLKKDKNFILLAKDRIDVSRLYNVAIALTTKGWSNIRRRFAIADDQLKFNSWSQETIDKMNELEDRCPWLRPMDMGYFTTTLAPKYRKPYLAIYRHKGDPTPTTPAPKGGKVQAIQELMAFTGIYTNAMRTFYTNNFNSKKYMVVDFYKALGNAKEGTIIGFKYINGKFEEPRTITFMSNLDVADGNKKGLAICKRMIGTAKALGFITVFRDMDAICMAEFHKEAKRIAVRSLWTNIEKYARLVKDTKFACLV